jgi:integrase
VPKDLLPYYTGKKLRAALHTTDRQIAKVKALEHVIKWKGEFEYYRSALRNEVEATPEQMEAKLKAEFDNIPSEEPIVLDDGSVEWINVDREAEVKSFAAEYYQPDRLDRQAQEKLSVAVGVATGQLVRLSDYIDGWVEQWDVKDKTKDDGRRTVQDFVKHLPYLHSVKRVAVKTYFNELGLAYKTQTKRLTFLRQFWIYVHDQLEIDEIPDPWRDAIPKKIKKANASANDKPIWDREAFTIEQLHQLHREANGQDLKDLIKIAAYTGMRREEICSLSHIEAENFVVLDAKTEAGNRVIPIHPKLREDNILERWEATKANLSTNMYGSRSDAIGKRFGRLKTSLGFEGNYTFHSIRHTVASELFRIDPTQHLVLSLMLGHSTKAMQSSMTLNTYVHGNDMVRARELIEGIPNMVGD